MKRIIVVVMAYVFASPVLAGESWGFAVRGIVVGGKSVNFNVAVDHASGRCYRYAPGRGFGFWAETESFIVVQTAEARLAYVDAGGSVVLIAESDQYDFVALSEADPTTRYVRTRRSVDLAYNDGIFWDRYESAFVIDRGDFTERISVGGYRQTVVDGKICYVIDPPSPPPAVDTVEVVSVPTTAVGVVHTDLVMTFDWHVGHWVRVPRGCAIPHRHLQPAYLGPYRHRMPPTYSRAHPYGCHCSRCGPRPVRAYPGRGW